MQPEQAPLVCYVVLNWNQAEMTTDCLNSLALQDYPNWRVCVVDNGSNDGSPTLLRKQFPWATILEVSENVGYSCGNNVGIEFVLEQGADYVFLLNNDTEVDPQMLTQLVEVAESDSQIGIVGPTMYYADPPNMIWGGDNRIDWRRARTIRHGFGELNESKIVGNQKPRDTHYVDTCAILVKRQVVERIGPMNSNYFINFDDLDWNARASKAGYRIVYVPWARMWHKVSATMGLASPATTYYMTRNSLLFFRTHAPGIWKALAPLRIVLGTARTIAAWTLKRQYRTEAFRRKRDANLLALRDFFLNRFGRMGPEVAAVCFDEETQ